MIKRSYDRSELMYQGRLFFVEFYQDGDNVEVWIEEDKMCVKLKIITVPVTDSIETMEDELLDFLTADDGSGSTALDSYIDSFE